MKEVDIHIKEVQRVPKKMNPKRATPRHIIIKMSKLKTENLKSSKRKEVSFLQESSHKTHLISQQKLGRPEGSGKKCSK